MSSHGTKNRYNNSPWVNPYPAVRGLGILHSWGHKQGGQCCPNVGLYGAPGGEQGSSQGVRKAPGRSGEERRREGWANNVARTANDFKLTAAVIIGAALGVIAQFLSVSSVEVISLFTSAIATGVVFLFILFANRHKWAAGLAVAAYGIYWMLPPSDNVSYAAGILLDLTVILLLFLKLRSQKSHAMQAETKSQA